MKLQDKLNSLINVNAPATKTWLLLSGLLWIFRYLKDVPWGEYRWHRGLTDNTSGIATVVILCLAVIMDAFRRDS